MKTMIKLPVLLALLSVLFFACQKETSFEVGSSKLSVGSLQADGTGGCLGAVVSGTYYKDSVLNATHLITLNVNVDTAGSYTIRTDTIQGYYFNASGNFTTTGTQVVKLRGNGKPLSVGTHIFTVTYNGTVCEFSVNVIAGSGGTAAFTISCTGAVLSGSYVTGTAMTLANTVDLNVNVTTIGTWGISTAPAVNGIIFSGSGVFTATGAQIITLTATGTPAATGAFNFPVAVGGTTCNFQVIINNPADYFPRTINSNWSYEFGGDPNDSMLIKVIPQTLTVSGNIYNTFMWTVDASLGFDTSGYYRRAGSDYFEWGDISWGILDNPYRTEYIFLKDNQTAGATWILPQFSGPYTPPGGSPVTVTLRWEFSVLQQNVTVTVGDTSYPNTIEIQQELRLLSGSNWIRQIYFRNYYARDKGLIKQDIYDDTGTLISAMDVRRLVIY
jgi:hypothetical protein